MSAPELVKRLWRGLRHRQDLGHIVIKFYPPSREASITIAPALAALSRRSWHWLYLQHLTESLAAIAVAQERARLLAAARAMAEDFVSRSYWPQVIGEAIADAGAGAAEIVPQRDGGVVLAAQVVSRDDGMPAVRLAWSPAQARERAASSNLVLLVHVMRNAAHPLEQYDLFKKIALFAEHCEREEYPRDRAALQGGALYAVVHADVTEMTSPSGAVWPRIAVPPAEPVRAARATDQIDAAAVVLRGLAAMRALRDRLHSPDPLWKRPRVAMGGAAVLWAALALAAFFVPRFGAPVSHLLPRPMAGAPSGSRHEPVLGSGRREIRPRMEARLEARLEPAATPRRGARPKTKPDAGIMARRSAVGQQGEVPRFRVVSGTLSLDVAEHRSKILAEQGVDAFVEERTGKLGRLQYGAYHFREAAEETARHLRAQGYTAVVIPW